MGDRDRRVAREEHERHGLADDARTTHDHRALPRRVDSVLIEHAHDARRRAGPQARKPAYQAAQVLGMEAIHVLIRSNRRDHRLFIEVAR